MTIAELRPYQDRTVILTLTDGETTTCTVALVDGEYEDIIVNIIHTSKPDNYRRADAAYTIAARDVASIQQAEEGKSR